MKIYGVDLSQINIYKLSIADYAAIHKALLSNVHHLYGEIDRKIPRKLIKNLQHYIKIDLLSKYLVFDASKVSGKPNLIMAMCLYMLPQIKSSNDPQVQHCLQIIKTLGLDSNPEIKEIRSKPVNFKRLEAIAKIIKREKERFNITGFWDSTVNGLLDIVSEQLLSAAYERLYEINKQLGISPASIATKAILFIEILHYINKRRNDPDFIILTDLYRVEDPTLHNFSKQVIILLRDALMELRDMPDKSHDSMVSTYGLLLFRASYLLKQAMYVSNIASADTNLKIRPGI